MLQGCMTNKKYDEDEMEDGEAMESNVRNAIVLQFCLYVAHFLITGMMTMASYPLTPHLGICRLIILVTFVLYLCLPPHASPTIFGSRFPHHWSRCL